MRWFCLLLIIFAAACGRDTLPAQCDAERRCAADPNPVCGADGTWYDCASVMQCEGIQRASQDTVCNAAPDPGCPPVDCDLDCPNGFDTGADGCEICACVEEPVRCEPVIGTCAVELERDQDGCEYCPETCPGLPNNCPDECYREDERGCGYCDCGDECPDVEPACESDPDCQLITDRDGCDYCQCDRPDPGRCDRLFCDNHCSNGYLIVDGCPTCECADPCPTVFCDVECPRQIDPATSCESACDCLQDSCPGVDCALACEHGFRHDANGCSVCECRGTPCDVDEQCGLAQHCVISPWAPATDAPIGECVPLERCNDRLECDDAGPCGFYFRTDCCPPLTTCDANLPACPPVCLLEMGDLP